MGESGSEERKISAVSSSRRRKKAQYLKYLTQNEQVRNKWERK